jgi:hypothetical protein
MARKYLVRTAVDHNFEENPMLEGRIAAKSHVEVESKDGKKKEKRNFFEIDTEGTLRRVWVSDNLQEAWERSEVGMFLNITYGGAKKTRSNRTVKKFAVQLWEEQ